MRSRTTSAPPPPAPADARRPVRFPTLGHALEDAEGLAAAETAGSLRSAGRWTLGQALGHLAWWADEPFRDHRFPLHLRVLFRVVGPLTKARTLRGDVRPGVRLPGVARGTYGAEVRPTDEGLASMRAAFARLDRTCPSRPDPGFGRLTHDEWRTLHRRHAEHHLSFFHPGEPGEPGPARPTE